MKTEVVRSRRRKKTVEARMVGEVLQVLIPAAMSLEEEEHWVSEMRERVVRKNTSSGVDLAQRATELSATYGLPMPARIEFSSRQRLRWGSCTPATASVRISDRLASFPPWVLDYVIVHELAHLVESNHSVRFWELVNSYPLAERARGYLLAMQAID